MKSAFGSFTPGQKAAIQQAHGTAILQNTDAVSPQLLEQVFGKEQALQWTLNNPSNNDAQRLRAQLDYIRTAWAASNDPVERRNLVRAMSAIATKASTPNNVRGNLTPDQTIGWLQERKSITDRLSQGEYVEATQTETDLQAKEGIRRNAALGMAKSARNSAARGVANSSIRETALADIDRSAQIARSDIDARMDVLKGRNDIERAELETYWTQYDSSLDSQRMLNAAPSAETPPPAAKPAEISPFQKRVENINLKTSDKNKDGKVDRNERSIAEQARKRWIRDQQKIRNGEMSGPKPTQPKGKK